MHFIHRIQLKLQKNSADTYIMDGETEMQKDKLLVRGHDRSRLE